MPANTNTVAGVRMHGFITEIKGRNAHSSTTKKPSKKAHVISTINSNPKPSGRVTK
jgi:hypothetical protein